MKSDLPYFDDATTVAVGSETVPVKAYQIVVWVSVSVPDEHEFNPGMPRFPAILDTGNNHNFAIAEHHLVRWAGLQALALTKLKSVREKGQSVPLRLANLWLHANEEPFWLDVPEGIAVYDSEGPRLPTLGLRALTNNRLRALVHGDEKRAIVRTPPPWYWPLG